MAGKDAHRPTSSTPATLREVEDYYLEDGLMVFTGQYHLKRGHCCKSACRHCPYGFKKKA